jgi:adenine-specific DNA-methyltransferase
VANAKGSKARITPSKPKVPKVAETYTHPEQTVPMRPEVGTQSHFRKKKTPKTYRYDSSLSPALDWDGQNGVRELGEWLLACIEEASAEPAPHELTPPRTFTSADGAVVIAVASLHEAVDQLKRLGKPFLTWTGKAERLSFDVPTLPLFVHERLSTKAIVETLVGHRRQSPQQDMFDLFGDPQHSVTDQVLRAYEYQDQWVNRLILGDSLVVMNSLLQYEGLGGQVQMIYIDPPYGVKFGSNFQPFVRKRDVSHNDDDDLTREPEMVKAYRDTWELGLHSYLTYMRDRLLLARDLLTDSGSVFVQISDENLHHVRELMDEVFGPDNFVTVICYRRLGTMIGQMIQSNAHYLLWYARDKPRLKTQKLFEPQLAGIGTGDHYTQLESRLTGETRAMSAQERANPQTIPDDWRSFQLVSLATGNYRPNMTVDYEFEGTVFHPGANKHWRTDRGGLDRLRQANRVAKAGNTLRYRQFLDDFPWTEVATIWTDTGRDPQNFYVVQTPSNVIERCILMTTGPGDLVLDPTCGSGTTAHASEQWGRRWITIDTSRVPLALARQRLLTATYDYYQLQDLSRGPAGGFVYVRRRNKKGEEVGGIVPHVTLKTIANNEPPEEEVLVDRPEKDDRYVRVSGPFTVEATIPTPIDWEGDGVEDSGAGDSHASFVDRMIEVLRRSPVLHVAGGKTVSLLNVRQPAKTLSLSAEAVTEDGQKNVAFVFGPESGAISEKLVHAALQEATLKSYDHLYVIGFAIQPHARDLIEKASEMGLVAATYVQATLDLMMGDLLKNMRSSQIFSVCGLPDVVVRKVAGGKSDDPATFQVELRGVDTFDPVTMDTDPQPGSNVPAWLLDTDYNDLCFHASQVFFPRTSAWENLRKALKADYDDSVWDHLSGTTSAPFEAGEHRQVAVKVIDDRGNELLVVKKLP